jgi:transposase
MKKRNTTYSPEVRERAVRMVLEHRDEYASEWEAINSIASKIGCSGETLRSWVRRAERDAGVRPGPTSAELLRIKDLEREVRELRQANEILRKASAYFAMAELDRPLKR